MKQILLSIILTLLAYSLSAQNSNKSNQEHARQQNERKQRENTQRAIDQQQWYLKITHIVGAQPSSDTLLFVVKIGQTLYLKTDKQLQTYSVSNYTTKTNAQTGKHLIQLTATMGETTQPFTLTVPRDGQESEATINHLTLQGELFDLQHTNLTQLGLQE